MAGWLVAFAVDAVRRMDVISAPYSVSRSLIARPADWRSVGLTSKEENI